MTNRCKGKIIYQTKREAKDAAKEQKKKLHRILYVYDCAVCGGFHLTSEKNHIYEPYETTPEESATIIQEILDRKAFNAKVISNYKTQHWIKRDYEGKLCIWIVVHHKRQRTITVLAILDDKPECKREETLHPLFKETAIA